MTSEKEKMLAGQLYDAGDSELLAMRLHARKQITFFNNEEDRQKRKEIIKSLFGSTGDNLLMEQRFVCEIHIGDNAMIGPNCQFLTPLHPLDAKERISGLEYGAPITIGDNVWLGGGVTILPGVTLGDNVVVGAGAVVTKSFGDNVVIAGNPAKIIKILD